MKTNPRSDTDDFASRYRAHRRLVRLGQAIMLIGFLVAVTHWLAHLEAFGAGQPPGWMDFAIGYPTAAILIIAGAILAGRPQPKRTTR